MVGDLIGQVVSASGVGEHGRLSALRRAWRDAVGRAMAEQARVVDLRAGTLVVEVVSAALGHELSVYLKRELLVELRRATKFEIRDLRCRVTGDAPGSGSKSR